MATSGGGKSRTAETRPAQTGGGYDADCAERLPPASLPMAGFGCERHKHPRGTATKPCIHRSRTAARGEASRSVGFLAPPPNGPHWTIVTILAPVYAKRDESHHRRGVKHVSPTREPRLVEYVVGVAHASWLLDDKLKPQVVAHRGGIHRKNEQFVLPVNVGSVSRGEIRQPHRLLPRSPQVPA